jgi:hypothetical protein
VIAERPAKVSAAELTAAAQPAPLQLNKLAKFNDKPLLEI